MIEYKKLLEGCLFIIVGLLFVVTTARAQQLSVRGTVTDSANGRPMVGVNIIVKGTTTGTATDKHGIYKIIVPSKNDTLIYTFIGYHRQAVPVKGRTLINVKLSSKITSSKQIVVTAFGQTEQAGDLVEL
jgi:hypothetical protein